MRRAAWMRVAVLVVVLAPPMSSATASRPFGPSEPNSLPGCRPKTAIGADGVARGFSDCISLQSPPGPILFVEGSRESLRVEPTEYDGRVANVAATGTTTYALIVDGSDLVLVERRGPGDYAAPRVLDRSPGGYIIDAELVATPDGWWAIWGTGTPELRQAKTIGTDITRSRFVLPGRPATVQLAARADGGAVLVYGTRHRIADQNFVDVRLAMSDDGQWSASRFEPASSRVNLYPSVATDAERIYVAWHQFHAGDLHEGPVVAEVNTKTGRTTVSFLDSQYCGFAYRGTKPFYYPYAPRVTASGGNAFVAWDCYFTSWVDVVERNDAWRRTRVSPDDPYRSSEVSLQRLHSQLGRAVLHIYYSDLFLSALRRQA